MKKQLTFLFLFFIICTAQAQFGSLTKKLKDKINTKLEKLITPKATEIAADTIATTQGVVVYDETSQTTAKQKEKVGFPEMAPITFPKTGKFDLGSKLTYAVDYDFFLQHSLGQKAIAIARKNGFTGTNKEVFNNARTDSTTVTKIWTELMKGPLPADALEIQKKFQIAATFEAMALASTSVLITNDFVKSTIKGIGSSKQKPIFLVGFQIDGFSLVDLQQNAAKTVGTIMGVNYTLIEKDFNVGSLFAMAKLAEKNIEKKGATSEVILNQKAFGYNCNVARIIIPVQPEQERKNHVDNSSLWFHCLLNVNFDDLVNTNYDPKYKIIMELYYTHDLDNVLPKALTTQKNKLNAGGYFVGAILKDEAGNGVTYKMENFKALQKIDKGEFQIPAGYPIMTQEELNVKILEAMKNGAQ
ncbi:hypothetical protein FFWV33_13625 [Flavobacterium faecale]|uniref:Uncharacterized protein n=1 Tax=Flavobacterium faecale TaxID=1355330 RepID=A0A2S1LFD3_9FLAO|nr:hypothetical protein [Flavobacterium faecale]AWG22492.1 hypothetical protein FFWV33_13625 [Flavobacterium faecale]